MMTLSSLQFKKVIKGEICFEKPGGSVRFNQVFYKAYRKEPREGEILFSPQMLRWLLVSEGMLHCVIMVDSFFMFKGFTTH